MIAIGDIVERPELKKRGRVTGFAPCGHARVTLENKQHRIWPIAKLRPYPPPEEIQPVKQDGKMTPLEMLDGIHALAAEWNCSFSEALDRIFQMKKREILEDRAKEWSWATGMGA